MKSKKFNAIKTHMPQPDLIYVLNKRVPLLQVPGGFRTSLDSVMLAAACPAQAGDRIFDLGCGVGGAGFCVLARVPGARLTGLDIQNDHILLAQENAVLNNVKDICDFICGDVRHFPSLLSPRKRGSSDAEPDSRFRGDDTVLFDHVICNPPYLDSGTYVSSPSRSKATALAHIDENLSVKDWIDAAFRVLKNGGSLTLIHRADHIDKIMQGLGRRFGALELIPLWPRAGEPAKRVIIRCLKNRKTPATIRLGLVLHQANGNYTPEANAVLRDMGAL